MTRRRINVEYPAWEYHFRDDRKLGSGWRVVLAHSRSKKTIELFDTARLVSTRIKLTEFDTGRKRHLGISRIVLGRNIAVRLTDYRRFRIRHAPATARAIIHELVEDLTT